jgi:hypothetical protein
MWRQELTGAGRDRYSLWPGIGTFTDILSLDQELREIGGRLIIDLLPGTIFPRVKGVDLKEDVIRNINKRYLINTARHGAVTKNYYNLNASGTAKLLRQDVQESHRKGFTSAHVFMENAASSFNRETVWRDAAVRDIASALGQAREQMDYISASRQNMMPEYFPYLDAIAGIPMRTALFPYITDTIPFTPLVLRGALDLFTQNLNNAANPEETLLRMIEWGVYPAYFITEEDANKLLYSDMGGFQSSRYLDWRGEIAGVYAAVNAALQPVLGLEMVNHEVLAAGVMKTSYENGAAVYVNYNSHAWEGAGLRLPPRRYEVRLP